MFKKFLSLLLLGALALTSSNSFAFIIKATAALQPGTSQNKQVLSYVILTYDTELGNNNISPDSFYIYGHKIVDVYTTRTLKIGDPKPNGKYVVLVLETPEVSPPSKTKSKKAKSKIKTQVEFIPDLEQATKIVIYQAFIVYDIHGLPQPLHSIRVSEVIAAPQESR